MGRTARRIAGAALLAGVALAAAPAPASEGDADDPMGGFEDDGFPSGSPAPAGPGAEAESTSPEPWWDLTGSLAVTGAFAYQDHRSSTGTDYQGLVGLRARLGLQLDLELPGDWQARAAGSGFYDFAYLANGRGEYANDVLDRYEWDADVGELWVAGPLLPALDVKLGRQIVNWGRSDTLRVLDVLNPLDNREPGLLDIVDLRLPVTMAKLSYYPHPSWSVTGIYIPEIRFGIDPAFGSDFYPAPFPPPPQITSNGFTDRPEWAAAVSGIFEGWDISFHFADIYEDAPRVDPTFSQPLGLQMKHSRVLLGGVGGNYTFGSWLVKGELAVLDGIDYATTGKKTRIDAMLGVEYYGLAENTFALEVANRHIDDFEGSLNDAPDQVRRDSVETALRWSADWWHARLHTTLLALVFGAKAQDGSVLRFSADYDIRDALVAGAGIQIFLKGTDSDGLLNPFARNDRVFLRIKYSF
jgi:hypothetical protein